MRINNNCVSFFYDIPLENWTQAHEGGFRYRWMTTNLSECMNEVLIGAQMLSINALAQITFFKCELFKKIREEIKVALERRDKLLGLNLKLVNKFYGGHVILSASIFRYTVEIFLKLVAKSSKHGVQSYDQC